VQLTLSSSAGAATAVAAAAAPTAEDAGGAGGASATSGIVMTLIGGRTTPSEWAPCARLALHAAPPDAVSADTTIASRAPSRVAGPYPS
jgi:hypothetical protein